MSTRRALAYSFVDRYSGLVIHTVTAVVIARLLTPGDVGVYSIAMVLIGFVATFRDLGAGQYLVQKQRLTEDDARAVLAVQLGLGLLLATTIAVASIPVANFYREPRIQGIMAVIALNFAITPAMAYPNAWLLREMRFGVLAIIRLSGAVATALAAIGLAWAGIGPISLAWGNLAGTLAGIVAIGFFGRLKLTWRPKVSGIGDVVSFGGKVTLLSLLSSINRGFPEIFLGRLQGMTETGLYSRAQGIVTMFDELVTVAVSAVALPYYAKQVRGGHDLKDTFLHASALITVLGWSFYGSLAILAYPTIRVLFGDQWDQAVDPARWLAVAGFFLVPASACFAPLLASGAIPSMLRIALLAICVNATLAGLGAYFGLLTLAKMLIGSAAISMLLSLNCARRYIGFRWTELLKTYGRSAAVAAATTSVPFLTVLWLGWRSPSIVLALSIAVPGGVAAFLVACSAVKHPIWSEMLNVLKVARAR